MRTKWLDPEGDPLPASRMTWLDLVILGLEAATATAQNAALSVEFVTGLVKSHYNAEVEQEEFHADVTQTIETLAEGDSHG